MPLSAGTRLGPYEIVSPLGAGGMGEVYRAHDSRLGRDVAIKVLPQALAADPDRLVRFEREARLLASLNHPNIAHIHGFEQSGGTPALVMELVEGETLAERLARGPIPLDEALPIARQVAEALEAAHEQGIIHRDLKPANVKVRPDGTVKVLDFGLAKAVDPAPASADAVNSPTLSARATQQGVILGTAAYMSPEQAVGKSADKRSDLWSFGVLLMEMLSGQRVFSGETVSHVLASVLKSEPDWTALPADTPAPIHTLLRRCLEKEPKRRLDSAQAARLEIDDALVKADRVVSPPAARRVRRSGSQIAIVGWSILATAAAAVFGVRLIETKVTPSDQRLARLAIEPPEGTTFETTSVSPDGRFIAYTAADASGHTDLWLRSLDTLDVRRLPDTEEAEFPFWSPDSQYVAYWSKGMLRKTAASGGPSQDICASPGLRGASWSATGVIIFSPSSIAALRSVSADGGNAGSLTTLDTSRHETSHRWPSFLPDGRHYLFTVRSSEREVRGIYIGSIGSRDRTRLVEDLSNGAYMGAATGPGWLLFARGGSLLSQTLDLNTERLAGQPTMVIDKLLVAGGWSLAMFSASDRVLVYQSASALATGGLAWFDRSGRRLPTAEGFAGRGLAQRASMSRDERQIVFDNLDASTGTFNLWTIDVARGISSKLTAGLNDAESTPVWSPDGSRIAFIGDSGLLEEESGGTNRRTLLASSGDSMALDDWSPDVGSCYSAAWIQPNALFG